MKMSDPIPSRPARDALYDALITGTQHAQIREHLVDAALEEDRATHAAGLGSTAEDEAALASLRGMATTRPGCVPSRAEVAEQDQAALASARAEAWDLRRAMLSECDLLERETAGLNPAVVAERRLAAARIRVVIDDLLPAVAALVEAAGPADTNEEA